MEELSSQTKEASEQKKAETTASEIMEMQKKYLEAN